MNLCVLLHSLSGPVVNADVERIHNKSLDEQGTTLGSISHNADCSPDESS